MHEHQTLEPVALKRNFQRHSWCNTSGGLLHNIVVMLQKEVDRKKRVPNHKQAAMKLLRINEKVELSIAEACCVLLVIR